MFEVCYSTQLLSFHLDLPLDAVSAVCHQLGLLSTNLDLISCAGFVETANWGFYTIGLKLSMFQKFYIFRFY